MSDEKNTPPITITKSITLPVSLENFVHRRVKERHHDNVSNYICWLIMKTCDGVICKKIFLKNVQARYPHFFCIPAASTRIIKN